MEVADAAAEQGAWLAAVAAPAGVRLDLRPPGALPPAAAAETAADAAAALAWLAASGERSAAQIEAAAAAAAASLTRTHAIAVGGECGHSGLALFRLLPLLNHGCAATCAPSFPLRAGAGVCRARLRASRALPAGAALTLCYTDATSPAQERRASLERTFLFVCRCPRCVGSKLLYLAAETALAVSPKPPCRWAAPKANGASTWDALRDAEAETAAGALPPAAAALSSLRRAAATAAMDADAWGAAAALLAREARVRGALRPAEGFGGGMASLADIALQLQLVNALLQAGEPAAAARAVAEARYWLEVSDPTGDCTAIARSNADVLAAELAAAAQAACVGGGGSAGML